MNLIEIKRSSWARRFKKSAPVSYAQALEYASEPELRVSIEQRSDLSEDKPVWAVIVVEPRSGDVDFWMDALKTKEAAETLCTQMGWRYE
jgi:hypothetical protein